MPSLTSSANAYYLASPEPMHSATTSGQESVLGSATSLLGYFYVTSFSRRLALTFGLLYFTSFHAVLRRLGSVSPGCHSHTLGRGNAQQGDIPRGSKRREKLMQCAPRTPPGQRSHVCTVCVAVPASTRVHHERGRPLRRPQDPDPRPHHRAARGYAHY
ncbi:hypothetical protein GWK47_042574 [Chionoecetes opilio]|uniref:Uncharacterized protein n=1 Tax=Chionoecetes opilio TaxID=41210 RepID=A0A8J4YFY8_CHIOP|nr:hypothetical protein GWK47_042574 [Chionoecetes opilio]